MSVRIMSAIWEIPMPPTDKLVLLALADCANDEGHCWPSIATIARKSGVSERSVQRAIRKAENDDLLKREEVIGKGCKYRLNPRHSVAPVAPSPVTNATPTPDTVSPKPSRTINPTVASQPTDRRAKARAVFSAPPGVPDQVWRDFLDSPKRKKAGMSETAYLGIERNLRICAEHGFPPGPTMELAVERGWTTVKLEWVQENGRGTTSRGTGNGGGRMGGHQSAGDGLSPTTRAAARVFGVDAGYPH